MLGRDVVFTLPNKLATLGHFTVHHQQSVLALAQQANDKAVSDHAAAHAHASLAAEGRAQLQYVRDPSSFVMSFFPWPHSFSRQRFV